MRGGRDGELPGHHLLSAYAPHFEGVLGQLRVDAETNEHKAALRLLGILPIKGKSVIGDVDPGAAREVAGPGAGLRVEAGANRQRRNDG